MSILDFFTHYFILSVKTNQLLICGNKIEAFFLSTIYITLLKLPYSFMFLNWV